MFKENRKYCKADIEAIVRDAFKHIINGQGFMIPRIAIKARLDNLFGKSSQQIDSAGPIKLADNRESEGELRFRFPRGQ